ncbi:MAG: aspartate--tRNA ligase, partial [Candidatus Woesearchaeota archaeon]
MRRTHTCGELTKKEVGKKVVLQGWVDSRRDHGGIIFIDLRDRYGKTQIVFDEKSGAEAHKKAYSLRREFVIEVEGIVRERKKGTEKKEWATGEIELHCYNLEILSQAETPPLEIDDRIEAGEESRLKYRYLDLRRPIMQHRLLFRSEVAQLVRNFLVSQNFVELETPFLIRSTPEGARDYIVPSRVNPGKVYSLPQSPQLYKQILMVAGFDRYFQLARCLRDEDLRADRQPEFTQIDVEMSFPEEEDIYNLGDKLIYYLFKKSLGIELKIPFPRITYEEAVRKYGIDKPDLRFGMELIDVTEILQKSDFEIFKKAKLIKCINAQQCAYFSRRDIEDLTNIAKNYNAKGLVAMKILGEKIESNVAKYI